MGGNKINREIKFRALVKDYNTGIFEMVEWNDCFFSDMSSVTGWGNEFPDKDDENIILMQFIGAKDKNNVEIYEGDKVKVEGIIKQKYNGEDEFEIKEGPYIGIITYNDLHFGIQEENRFHYLIPEITEIIGNMYNA
jgi:uncharacterized phage protein (TIGR01671 family)